MSSNNPKEAFHTPFKRAALSPKAQRAKLQRCLHRFLVSQNAHVTDATPTEGEAAGQSRGALPRQTPETMMQPVVSGSEDTTASALTRHGNSGVDAFARQRLASENAVPVVYDLPATRETATAQRALLMNDTGAQRAALVRDTRLWITASQRAVRYLADTLTGGDVERILAELHLDSAMVLFNAEEGDFVAP